MSTEDQKVHMENLVKQAKELSSEVNNLQAQMNTKRDLLLKVQGAIEYLQQVGVSLPGEETDEAPVVQPAADSEAVSAALS